MTRRGNRVTTERRCLRVVTYNVHACIGNDGEFSPQRICDILRDLRADFVGIQELEDRTVGTEPVSEYLARNLDMHAYRGSTLMRQDAHYGNLLLSREPAQAMRLHEISVTGREPRGVIDAMYDLLGKRVRVLVTHFGLRAYERRSQVDKLLTIADSGNADVDVILGDLNEWRPASYAIRTLKRRFPVVYRRRTWPADRPVLSLDCVGISPATVDHSIHVEASPATRRASDHLPVVCDLYIPGI
jgi:endonuclease/exonuclease/phosphatase family metal-dependent hydrolase